MKLGVPVISHMFYSGNPCNKLLGTVKEREEERSAERVGHAGVAGLPAPPQLPPEHPAARSAVPPHLEPQVLQPLRRSAFFRICSDKVTALRGALSYAIVVAISISADIYSAKQCGIGLTLQKAAHEGGLITTTTCFLLPVYCQQVTWFSLLFCSASWAVSQDGFQ